MSVDTAYFGIDDFAVPWSYDGYFGVDDFAFPLVGAVDVLNRTVLGRSDVFAVSGTLSTVTVSGRADRFTVSGRSDGHSVDGTQTTFTVSGAK